MPINYVQYACADHIKLVSNSLKYLETFVHQHYQSFVDNHLIFHGAWVPVFFSNIFFYGISSSYRQINVGHYSSRTNCDALLSIVEMHVRIPVYINFHM